ncbi:MAG: hypothetical protein IJU95_05380 [Treponema sp.]|nr:hypothetical protein [Treponema sp.]
MRRLPVSSAEDGSEPDGKKRPDFEDKDGLDGVDLDALEEELGQILDDCVQEALNRQRKAFEKDYSRLWDSRSFWRKAAVGEGCAMVAALIGGILVWNLSR